MLKVVNHCRKLLVCFALALLLCGMTASVSPMIVHASSIEDNVTGNSGGGNSGDLFSGGELSQDEQDLASWITNQKGISGDNLAKASNTLSPLTNILGNITGGILVLIFAGVFVITGLDLLYITIPPIRGFLYKGEAQSGGGAMPGGYGARGGYGAQSMNQGMANEAKSTQWISDEAIQCSAMLKAGGAQPQQMGGYGMGGMQQGASPEQNMSMKSVIGVYFKKRMFFMILLAVCAIVLTSSKLLGTGVNLGAWVLKILSAINNNIPK